MSSDDQYAAILLAFAWPVRAAFNTCPVMGALWCISLAHGPPHPDDLELAAEFAKQAKQLVAAARAPS